MILTPRPRARLKIGQHFMGKKTSFTAEGYALYKEWDTEDRKYYYWEEWELRGGNNIDSWIEYDHYTKLITHYEPAKINPLVDPRGLLKNQLVTINDGNIPQSLRVKEAGKGTLVRREGTFSYHIFEGDPLEYAELVDSNTGRIAYSAERYNDREFDTYRATVLSKTNQKNLFGKVLQPLNYQSIFGVIFYIILGIVALFSSFWPNKETYCTPRTLTGSSLYSSPTSTSGSTITPSSSDTLVSENSSQRCYSRTVYGFGGSGAGK